MKPTRALIAKLSIAFAATLVAALPAVMPTRAEAQLAGVSMHDLLTHGDDLPPGPRTRPASVFLRNAYGGRIRRLVADLWEADERHGSALKQL